MINLNTQKPLSHKDFAIRQGVSERTLSRQRVRLEETYPDYRLSWMEGKTRFYNPEYFHLFGGENESEVVALATTEYTLPPHLSRPTLSYQVTEITPTSIVEKYDITADQTQLDELCKAVSTLTKNMKLNEAAWRQAVLNKAYADGLKIGEQANQAKLIGLQTAQNHFFAEQ